MDETHPENDIKACRQMCAAMVKHVDELASYLVELKNIFNMATFADSATSSRLESVRYMLAELSADVAEMLPHDES